MPSSNLLYRAPAGSEFTQPRDHSFAQPSTVFPLQQTRSRFVFLSVYCRRARTGGEMFYVKESTITAAVSLCFLACVLVLEGGLLKISFLSLSLVVLSMSHSQSCGDPNSSVPSNQRIKLRSKAVASVVNSGLPKSLTSCVSSSSQLFSALPHLRQVDPT